MRKSIAVVFVAAMFVASHGTAAEDQAPPAKALQFSVRIFEGDPLGSVQAGTLKILADTRVTTLENRPAWVASGKEVQVDDVATPVVVGLRLEVNPGVVNDGKVCVDMTLSRTTAGEKANEQTQFHIQSTRTITTIKLGEVMKTRWGARGVDKQSWVELTLEEVSGIKISKCDCGVVSRP